MTSLRAGWCLLGVGLAGCPGPGEVPDAPPALDASIEASPLTADEAARYLVVAASCPGSGTNGLSDRTVAAIIRHSEEHAGFAELARCVVAVAPDCAAILACGQRAGVVDGTCSGGSRCEGDRVLLCIGLPGTPASLAIVDCAALGTTCVMGPMGTLGCGEPCTDSACDADGRGGLFCASGIGTRVECRAGLRCSTDGLAPVTCVGDGAACTEGACSGSDHTECDDVSGAARPAVDCRRIGTCTTEGCVATASECAPDEDEPSCDGTVITYCGPDHRPATLDCAALGYVSCREAPGSGTFCLRE
jgi:hypothetical protein